MRISLRLKLALLSLFLLAIPLTGFRISSLLHDNLLETRKETLMFSARAVASALGEREGLFDRELFHSLNRNRDLYLFQLENPMRLNGKTDDWSAHLQDAQRFGVEHLLYSQGQYRENSLSFQHLLGTRGKYLYTMFIVIDDHLVYRKKDSLLLTRADHLQIGIEDKNGKLRHYRITTEQPGWVNGYLLPEDPKKSLPIINEPQIQGVWLETSQGYNLELRIPLSLIGHKMAFAVADVDNAATGTISHVIGTANPRTQQEIGWLLSPSTSIVEFLEPLNRPHSRIQIVDINQRIRASFGSLKTSPESQTTKEAPLSSQLLSRLTSVLTPLHKLFTEPFITDFPDPSSQPTTLELKGVSEGLAGKSSITSYSLADGQVEVMAAITPLKDKGEILGVVVVEQTTNEILALKNRVIEESITLAVLVFFFGGLGLILFAFRISSRIRNLRNQSRSALGDTGVIQDIFTPSRAGDEIGDLSRTLASMLAQLKTQSDYREKMADNLEHEMRTPLASVSASLKNIAGEIEGQPGHIQEYVHWALRDIRRLEELLTAIRDATNLKDALAGGFMEKFNLTAAISLWLEHGWKPAFPAVQFTLTTLESELPLLGDPDRLRQMLDKLIENSVAFHRNNTPIELNVIKEKKEILLQVINEGPTIPEEMLATIFNSMVSMRSQPDSKPHLGLGLYIVRTIAEFHGGRVNAKNLTGDRSGVCFSIYLPIT